jgi:hypothetical protein
MTIEEKRERALRIAREMLPRFNEAASEATGRPIRVEENTALFSLMLVAAESMVELEERVADALREFSVSRQTDP